MTITVFIRYRIDPFKAQAFEAYARRWLEIIPACGGDLIGYWMDNFAFAVGERLILGEERSFLRQVEPASRDGAD